MDIIDLIFRLIGIAGVIIVIMAFIGCGFLWALTRNTQSEEIDYDPDDPDPGETIKIPDKYRGFSSTI